MNAAKIINATDIRPVDGIKAVAVHLIKNSV